MTQQTKMPDPVASRWRVPIPDSVGNQGGESDWKFGAKRGGLPWWTQDSLITTDQAEAYAAERVREALEQAAQIVLDGIDDESSIAALATRRNAAEEIRSIITRE